jgi:hypothetical protein
MFGAIMLEKEARPRSLKPNIDLPLLFGLGMIIPVAEGKITKRFPVEWMAKLFLGFLRQHGEVEPAAKNVGLVPDINELLAEPALNLLRQPMEDALFPGIEREGMVVDNAAQPASPKLVELGPADPQDLTRPVFPDPVLVERFMDPLNELPRETSMQLVGHG